MENKSNSFVVTLTPITESSDSTIQSDYTNMEKEKLFEKPKNLFKIFLIKSLHLPISNSVCYFQVFVHSSSTVCGNFPTKQKFVPQSSV
ncbi:hypothetical protein ABE42_17325 [Bacillus thuringiensis]|nr:hypothetical protein [Bacillus thuringiensis]